MAYTHPSLHRVGPSNSDAPTIWTYSTTDPAATVDTTGYFDDAADDLTVGDLIYAITGSTFGLFVVLSISAGVVDVSNATALGGSDTD